MKKWVFACLLMFLLVACSSPEPVQQVSEPVVEEPSESVDKRQIFYDLVQFQDSVDELDPNWQKNNEESYKIIADKYGVTEAEVKNIGVKGVMNNWPMPPQKLK